MHNEYQEIMGKGKATIIVLGSKNGGGDINTRAGAKHLF